MRRDIPRARWQTLSPEATGLTSLQVHQQRARFGRNDIIDVVANPWMAVARATLKDPMIGFLVATGAVYGLLGSYTESVTLLVAILPLIGMDAFLHRRTQASTEGLSRQLADTAVVMRDGRLCAIPAAELVPGDRVRIKAGESFPADGRIVEGLDIQVDESSLTGESLPVAKRHDAMPLGSSDDRADSIWLEGDQWGFAGTRLLTGTADMQVIFTGRETLYGQIVEAASARTVEQTPLQVAIGSLVKFLMVAAAILCLILAAVRLRQGHDWLDALVSAATLAVAALPEEFPVVFSVFLGVGVYRLARGKALVRRGVSVENIGRVTCVCSDKTGTITEGRLRLEHLLPASNVTEEELLEFAALASRAESGDPVDQAIIERQGSSREGVVANYPYTEGRRRETTVIRTPEGLRAVSKGAPEALLEISSLDPTEREFWLEQVRRFAAQGHKVLACVHWHLDADWVGGEPDRNAVFAGLLACEDRIRHGVREAVRECLDAGIRVIMLTGDHPATAASVARDIGLIDSSTDGVILGESLEDAGTLRDLADIRVVARALPAQKLDLVRALRNAGEIVAVTGDGVNDVPALQAADIGIAMGERGTRSAREIASIVLLNDNFSTIVRAIAEGRQLFLNLQLSFLYILMLHIPLVVTAAFVPLAGYPILYLPIHIVWYEMIIHPTALLAFQARAGQGPLRVLEKREAARFFSRGDWLLIGAVGALLTLLLLWTFDRSLYPDENLPHARAMAMVVLTCASASATAVLSRLRTVAAGMIVLLTLASSLLLVQVGQLSRALDMEPLHWDDWLIAMAGGMLCVSVPVGIMQVAGRLKDAARKRGRELGEVNLAASMEVEEPVTTPAPGLMRYAVWSVITALVTIALKAGAYLMTGSVALLSDAAESLVNLVAACFALLTLKVASQPADRKHPFGHGTAEYFSSGFEGAMILLAAAGIIYSAVERLFDPHPLTSLDWGMGVAIVASALNLLMARALLRAGRQHRSIILEADGHHLMTDVWTTGAILLGLGGVALTDWLWLDSAIAILAALNIVFAGIRLISRSLSGLMGSALPEEDRQIIEDILKPYRQRGYDFHDLRARIAGSHRFVTFHVLVPGDMTIQDAHQLLDEIEAAIARKLPNLLIVTHVEPLDDPASFRHEMID